MRLLSLLILLLAPLSHAVTRDFPLKWSQEMLTVDGDPIERIEAFRVYTSDGVFVQLLPGTVRSATVRANVPWGRTCFVLTSSHVVDGTEYESDKSASAPGGCFDVAPGKPVRPEVQ